MITLDTFARHIRDRMPATGGPAPVEPARPAAAAAAAAASGTRLWAADPAHTDHTIRENTGATWDEWVDMIDAGPGRLAGHTAIAAWVHARHGVPEWWAQGVTVGYERITGLRMPGQMPDGTFSVSRTRVLSLPATLLREVLLDDGVRADLFPGIDTVLRSKPATKALRFAVSRDGRPLGSLLVSADPLPDGRVRVTVTHDKLAAFDDGEQWKRFWGEWLAVLADTPGDFAPGDSSPNHTPAAAPGRA